MIIWNFWEFSLDIKKRNVRYTSQQVFFYIFQLVIPILLFYKAINHKFSQEVMNGIYIWYYYLLTNIILLEIPKSVETNRTYDLNIFPMIFISTLYSVGSFVFLLRKIRKSYVDYSMKKSYFYKCIFPIFFLGFVIITMIIMMKLNMVGNFFMVRYRFT